MGQASSHALGLALGSPDRRVIVLDGDGSLLMNLGSLVTIANVRPKHFLHLVFENGVYEVNGGHPIPGTGHCRFCGMAKAAGYQDAMRFSQLDAFEAALPELLACRRASDGGAENCRPEKPIRAITTIFTAQQRAKHSVTR